MFQPYIQYNLEPYRLIYEPKVIFKEIYEPTSHNPNVLVLLGTVSLAIIVPVLSSYLTQYCDYLYNSHQCVWGC